MSDDFEFLYGKWTIFHKRLKKRLAGATEWIDFQTDYEAWPLLGGLANVDKAYGTFDGEHFEGVSLRTYDANSGEWTIYWMDTNHPVLTEQVRGNFTNGVGAFFGEEDFEGRKVKLRFTWKKIDDRNAYWDQAYQDPDTGDWEVNWMMEFRRKTV